MPADGDDAAAQRRGPTPLGHRTGSPRAHALALVLAVVGLALSIYLTVEHYTNSALLACPASATINCAKVTTSQWSVIAGVPVSVLGVAYYAGMTAVTVPRAWRMRALRNVRMSGAAAGVAMVLYLVYVELFDVDAICLWCTAVHVCTIALFGTVLWTSVEGGGPRSDT